MKTLYRSAVIALVVLFCSVGVAYAANIKVVIDKSDQMMYVTKDGKKLYNWYVSTGKKDSWTPNGRFGIQSLSKHHVSSIYGSPMPFAIFFNGDVAIHGTTEAKKIGRRASHGCVRLLTANAKKLFSLAEQGHAFTIVVKS